MNYKMVRYTLGVILLFEALFLVAPILTALYFGEQKSLYEAVCKSILTTTHSGLEQ